jgi:hypothetical protein
MTQKVVPMIHVPDVRATVEWYQNIGFDVVQTYGKEGEGFSFAIVSFGDTWVMFNEGGQPSTSRRREVDLYVYTDKVDDLYEQLKDRVDIIEGPHDTFYGQREVIIRDLNRFWITFGQESLFAVLINGVREGNVEMVRTAISRGPSADNLSAALSIAARVSNAEIVDVLKQAGARLPVEVDATTLQAYAGKYTGGNGMEIKVTNTDGHLYASHEFQEPILLVAIDETKFRPIAFDDASITFNVESGTVTGIDFTLSGVSRVLIRNDG